MMPTACSDVAFSRTSRNILHPSTAVSEIGNSTYVEFQGVSKRFLACRTGRETPTNEIRNAGQNDAANRIEGENPIGRSLRMASILAGGRPFFIPPGRGSAGAESRLHRT